MLHRLHVEAVASRAARHNDRVAEALRSRARIVASAQARSIAKLNLINKVVNEQREAAKSARLADQDRRHTKQAKAAERRRSEFIKGMKALEPFRPPAVLVPSDEELHAKRAPSPYVFFDPRQIDSEDEEDEEDEDPDQENALAHDRAAPAISRLERALRSETLTQVVASERTALTDITQEPAPAQSDVQAGMAWDELLAPTSSWVRLVGQEMLQELEC